MSPNNYSSIQNKAYRNWNLSDNSKERKERIKSILERVAEFDKKLRSAPKLTYEILWKRVTYGR